MQGFPGLTARPARLHAARSASTNPANPCLPNAPPVADAERSASSQPNPSRRKSCPAPTAAEPATTSPQLPGQSRIKPCGPITANPTPGKNGSTSGGTRASAAVLAPSAYARPNATESRLRVETLLRFGLAIGPSGSMSQSVAPSPQRPPKSSILAGAASFGHGTGMRLGSGASRCRLAQHGGNHGQRRLRFSAVLLYGIIRHGDCPRGREPAHLMQPLCLATLLGQCVQVRENVAGD